MTSLTPPPLLRLGSLVFCTGILFGHGISSIAGVLDTLSSQFVLGLAQSQFLVFVLIAGCFVGAGVAGPGASRWGRRPLLWLASALAIAAYAFILGAPTLRGLLVARALAGLAIGLFSMLAPLYAAEAVAARWRGAIVALFQLAITAGILLAYGLALVLQTEWHLVLGLGLVPGVLAALSLAGLPESPRWLALHARAAQAEHASARLGLANEHPAPARPGALGLRAALMQGSVLRVTLLCSALFVLQNLSGIDGILYYAPQIFKALGFSAGDAALAATFGLGAVNFLATVAAVALVDRLGRRKLWIGGSGAMALGLALVVLAARFELAELGLLGLCVYVLAFALSLGPLPYVLMSELFPSTLRESGMATASAVSWLFNALIALSFLSAVETFSLAGTMLFFLGVCASSLVLGARYLPETRMLSLEAIEARVLQGLPLRQLGSAQPHQRIRPLAAPALSTRRPPR